MGITLRGTLGLLMLATAFGAVGYWLGHLRAQPEASVGPVEVVEPLPNVVLAVQKLGRLETVGYHMERVIDLKSRQRRLFGLVEADDAILLIAVGDVVAGVDLDHVGADSVTLDWQARSVRLEVPEPSLFSARLDSRLTRVVRRSTDVLAVRVPDIETRARRLGEEEIREAALEAGILEEARDNAQQTLASLLGTLGFREVEVRFRPVVEAD